MSIIVVIATVALVAGAALAVWRAWAANDRASQEAAARAEAEERARHEAERASQEAAARAKAEARARHEAERASQEAAARAKAEARARAAERRAARLGADLSEARTETARTVPERDLVNALRKALPAMDPERAKRLENQLESLARLRERAKKLREELTAASDEEVRGPLREKLSKVESDAEALITRLRNVVAEDPALSGVRLSLAWGARVSCSKKPNEKKEEK